MIRDFIEAFRVMMRLGGPLGVLYYRWNGDLDEKIEERR